MISVHQAAKLWNMTERRITECCRAGKIIGAKKIGNSWQIPEDSKKPRDGRFKNTDDESIREKIATASFTSVGARENTYFAFLKKYGRKPTGVVFTPYRICPIGAHVDHNLGKITGFAIDKGIHIAYGAKQNGVVEISSLQFPKRAQWHVLNTPETKQNDWADHLRGATVSLAKRYPLRIGLSAVIDGELPIGGLSSSAAVIITYLSALCELNGIKVSEKQLIEISKEAENKYVGVSCGTLDQSCEIYCKKDHLLYLDTKDGTYELIPAPADMDDYEFIIFFSGVERSLAQSRFNMRVDELRSAAYSLKAYSGMEYGKFEETALRDVPYEVFQKYKSKLPTPFSKRAQHWYDECKRVEEGVAAWRRGDISEYGRLCFESGRSSIELWETGSPELSRLYEIMTKTKGIYGGRFSGAGFKGCCMAIVDPKYEKEIMETVEREYLSAFPQMRGKFSAHVCHTSDGVKIR